MSNGSNDTHAAPRKRVEPLRGVVRQLAHHLAALVLCGMALLLVHAALTESPTIDEPSHIVRGLAYLSTGDARLSVAHPPLGNLVQGIPGHLLDGPTDFASHPGWNDGWNLETIGRSHFGKHYERARTAIVGGRLVTALLTLLLGAYLYLFCLRFGRARALLTLSIYATLPVFLAHGHLATTDMPLTVAVMVAVGEFVRWAETGSRFRFATFSVAAGIAFATKFSGLFLIPALGLAGLVLALRGDGPYANRSLLRRLGLLARDFVLVGLVGLLVVNAAYGFQRTGWSVEQTLRAPEPANWITRDYKGRLLEELSPLSSLPAWLPLPVPYPWFFGLHSIRAQAERGHGGWFFGKTEPSRLYFPTLAAIKTPAAVLLLALVGIWLLVRRRRLPTSGRLALWLTPVLLLSVSTLSEIQIGVRHVLPIFPFLVLAAGWVATVLFARRPALAVVLIAVAATEAVASAPAGYLGHFSWAIGGPKVGHQISMIAEDWGQDVRALAMYARENELELLYYKPYGYTSARELRRFGTRVRQFSCKTKIEKPSWVAIHATELVRWKRDCGVVTRAREPDHKIAEHIWLYRIEPETPAGEEAEGAEPVPPTPPFEPVLTPEPAAGRSPGAS